MDSLKAKAVKALRFTERYTKTDMVYLAKGSFWMNASYFTVNFFALILSIAYARLLPKEVYGTYQYLLSISSILGAFTLTGMNNAVTQAVARSFEGTVKASIYPQIKYNLLSSIVSIAVSFYYFSTHNYEIALGSLIIGILTPLTSTFNTYTAFLLGKSDFKGGFTFGLRLWIPYNALMLVSLFFVKNPIFLLIVNLGVNAGVSIYLFILIFKKYSLNDKIDFSAVSYGKHLSLAGAISTIYSQLDNIVVFHFLGTANLAIYSFASTLPEKLNGLLKTVTVMAFPKLSLWSRDHLKKNIFLKTLYFAGLALMISTAYIIFAPLLFKYLFPQYLDSISYSQFYAIALVFMTLPSMALTGLTATRSKKEIYIYNSITSVIGIILMSILALRYGIIGLISAKAISGAIGFIVAFILIVKKKSDVQIP